MTKKPMIRWSRQRGAETAEWIVIVGLLVIGCIVAWTTLGSQIRASLATQGQRVTAAASGGGT